MRIYAKRPTYGSHLQNAGSFAPKLRNQAALIVSIVATTCVSGKMTRYKKEASLAAIRSVNVGNLSLTKLSEGVMRKSALLIMGILVGLIFLLLAHLIWTSQSHAQSPSVKHIERIGAIRLGILLPLPGDAQLVGLDILDCTQTRNRDVAYIFASDYSVASLRSIYETEMRNAEVKWSVKDSEKFSFTVFQKGSKHILFSLSSFRGLSKREGQALGLSEKEYHQRSFIFVLVDEPPAEGGMVVLPLLLYGNSLTK